MHGVEGPPVVQVEGLSLSETPLEPGTSQLAWSSFVQILIVTRFDEQAEPDVRHERLLRPEEGAQDEGVQLVVKFDDLAAPLRDDEEQPVIPRLLGGRSGGCRTTASGTPRSAHAH